MGLSRKGEQVLKRLAKLAPSDYAPTCYGKDGRLLVSADDELARVAQVEAQLVEPHVLQDVERRLKELEEQEYDEELGDAQ